MELDYGAVGGTIADVMERREIPAIVTFHKVAKEDPRASLAAGHYVAVDVDYAHVTPPYSKDVNKFKITTWFANMENDVKSGRMPRRWYDDYKAQYEAWQRGQELPPNGTPIRGWGVIGPAEQETLIRMKILTVEALALVNDEGVKAIGMMGLDLKNKAQAWIATMRDKGPVVMENAALKREVQGLKNQVANLTAQNEELRKIAQQATTGRDNLVAEEVAL